MEDADEQVVVRTCVCCASIITRCDTPTKDNNKKNDEQALYQHYEDYHPEEIKKIQNQLSKAYKIIFVEKPPTHKLDTAENFWIHKLKSKINIMKAQLPNYK